MRSLRPGVGEALRITGRPVRLPLRVVVVAWVTRRTSRLLLWLLRRPVRLAAVAALSGLVWAVGTWGPLVVAEALTVLVGAVTTWGMTHPASWRRTVAGPARAWWRSRTVYRWRWQPAVVTAGLARRDGPVERLPTLLRVRSTDEVDRLVVRMLPGHTVTAWQEAAEQLTAAWRVLDVRPRAVPRHPDRVELLCLTRDPLREVVPLPPAPDLVDYRAVEVGRHEDGSRLTLPVLGTHLLVGGATGAGKGSVLWSLLAGLGPGIRDGLVKVWAIDPKGGMELGPGRPLFDRFADGAGTDPLPEVAELLDLAVEAMRLRAARLRRRGQRKLDAPTLDDPLVLVLVDELAAVTALAADPELRRRIGAALRLLLSQGRAVGFAVVGATQDARKETTDARDWFPHRIALRTTEPEQADLILGRGARRRGARTEAIPDGLPGIGYVLVDGAAEPSRVRFAKVDDATIERLAEQYRPAPVVTTLHTVPA